MKAPRNWNLNGVNVASAGISACGFLMKNINAIQSMPAIENAATPIGMMISRSPASRFTMRGIIPNGCACLENVLKKNRRSVDQPSFITHLYGEQKVTRYLIFTIS